MSLRVLLALLIILALVASLVISLYAGAWFESQVGVGNATETHSFIAWAVGPLPFEMVVSLVSGILISVVFFVIVNMLVVRPLRLINRALSAFTGRSERIQLPSFAASPREVRNLAREFADFSTRVEESHARDLEISRIKSDFISTAAHQLRTPLTGIRWALEALEKEPLTESQQALVKSAVDKSHDLVSIVGTLLDISSIESGKYKYQFAEVDIGPLVTEVATDFIEVAKRAGVVLAYNPPGSTTMVRIDRDRMKWVLNNLIENAIHYTPRGGSVHINIDTIPERVMVHIRDTGIGIRDEDRNNIFERFFRAENAVAKENQGNGLGLYIARSIVKDHNGDLFFESNTEGPGTTFTLALPARAPR